MIRNIPIASLHQKFMEILNYTKPLYMRVQFFHALLVISELVGEMNQGYIFKSKMQNLINKFSPAYFVMFVSFHYLHKVICNGILMHMMVFVLNMPTFHIYVFNAVFVVSKIARRID